METNNPHFIIVDDDKISNFITRKAINKAYPFADVIAFTEPEEGLNHIMSNFAGSTNNKAILLLDINMPSMTGWQFMERVEKKASVVKRLLIYILSSSVDSADKEKAKVNPLISDYIMKPLTAEVVLSFDLMRAY